MSVGRNKQIKVHTQARRHSPTKALLSVTWYVQMVPIDVFSGPWTWYVSLGAEILVAPAEVT